MPFEHWFTAKFNQKKDEVEKSYYQGFWEGYVAYRDSNIDRVDKSKRHKVDLQWDDDFTVRVMLDPLLNPEDAVVTYSLPAVVIDAAEAAASDPPLPPPPKG